MFQLVSSEAVVLSVCLVVIGYGHAPDGEHTVDIVPHPGVILGPPRCAIFVQEGWQESCNGMLCVRGACERVVGREVISQGLKMWANKLVST